MTDLQLLISKWFGKHHGSISQALRKDVETPFLKSVVTSSGCPRNGRAGEVSPPGRRGRITSSVD